MDQKPENTVKVFVSYKRLDKNFVEKLVNRLEASGIDVWTDWKKIPTGEDWREEIKEGLFGAHAFLLVISPDAVASPEVGVEIDMALENNKRILPVMYRDEEGIWGRLPRKVSKVNAVNMRSDEEFETGLPKLLEAMQKDYQHLRKHTKLQNRALDWINGNRRKSALLRGEDLQKVEDWMVEAVSKDPPPTEQQAEYTRASREDETRRQHEENIRQRRILFGVSVGLVIAVVLGLAALFQWNRALAAEADAKQKQVLAQENADTARRNEVKANNNLGRALVAEKDAKEKQTLAETNAKLASDNAEEARQNEVEANLQRDRAIEQQLIAFARRLGAEGLSALQSSEIERSLLLSIIYTGTLAIPQADLALRTGLDLMPRSVAVLDGNVAIGSGVATGGDSGISGAHQIAHANPAVYNQDGSLLFTSNGRTGITVWNTAKFINPVILEQGSLVVSLAVHPDKPWLAAGSIDGSLVLWDLDTNTIIRRYENPNPVTQIVFNPNGSSFATAGDDNTVRLWSTGSTRQLMTIQHLGKITHLAFSKNGTYLASSGEDGRVKFYNVTSRGSLLTLESPSAFTAMSFHPTNIVLITGNADGLVQVWDMTNGREFRRLSHESAITDVLISPDASMYITAGEDSTVRVWDTSNGQNIKTFLHGGPVRDIAIDASSRYLASTSDDGTVRIWDLVRSQELARSPLLGKEVIFSPREADTEVAVMAMSGKINVFDYTSAQQAYRTMSLETLPAGLAVGSQDGNPVAVVAAGSRVMLWNYASGGTTSALEIGAAVLDVALNSQGDLLATGDNRGRVCLWEVSSGSEVFCRSLGGSVRDVDFSPDGSWLVAAGPAATVLDAGSGDVLYEIPLQEDAPEGAYITAVALDQEGKRLAVATSEDPSAHFYDLESGQLIFQTAPQFGLEDAASLVEYIPSRNALVTNQGQNIFVWDAATGNLYKQFFNTSNITGLAVAPDGSKLAIAGEDFNAYVWDLETGNEVARVPHAGEVVAVFFETTSARLVTASADGLVQVSNLGREDLKTEACRRLTRNLSFTEWMLYIGGDRQYARTCNNLPFGDGVQDALISQALSLALEGKDEDAENTLKVLKGVAGVQEQYELALASQVEVEMINSHLDDAISLAEYMASRSEGPVLIPVTGGAPTEITETETKTAAAIARVCRISATQQPDRAVPVCDYALKLDPENPILYDARGEARARTGDLAGALADFEIAQQLDSAGSDQAAARQAIIDALKKGDNPFSSP